MSLQAENGRKRLPLNPDPPVDVCKKTLHIPS